MLAGAQADMDALQRLLMTEPTLLNHRGFLHGYTALHWAAKHGRMDILGMLLMQGAHTDVRTVSYRGDSGGPKINIYYIAVKLSRPKFFTK